MEAHRLERLELKQNSLEIKFQKAKEQVSALDKERNIVRNKYREHLRSFGEIKKQLLLPFEGRSGLPQRGESIARFLKELPLVRGRIKKEQGALSKLDGQRFKLGEDLTQIYRQINSLKTLKEESLREKQITLEKQEAERVEECHVLSTYLLETRKEGGLSYVSTAPRENLSPPVIESKNIDLEWIRPPSQIPQLIEEKNFVSLRSWEGKGECGTEFFCKSGGGAEYKITLLCRGKNELEVNLAPRKGEEWRGMEMTKTEMFRQLTSMGFKIRHYALKRWDPEWDSVFAE